jgi:acetyltransferase-like isoleucine patch superfamily enzyme
VSSDSNGVLRFQTWRAVHALRLRRRGITLRVEGSPPRWRRAPHLRASGRGTVCLRFGEGVTLGRDVTFETVDDASVELGAGTALGDRVLLRGARGGTLRTGARCEIRSDAVLRFTGPLLIGDRVMLSHWVMLNMSVGLTIGSRSVLAERVTVVDSDHSWDRVHTYAAPVEAAPTRIGDNVLISANSVVTRGVELPDGVIVAGGAVVGRGEWSPNTLIGGVPARELKPLG